MSEERYVPERLGVWPTDLEAALQQERPLARLATGDPLKFSLEGVDMNEYWPGAERVMSEDLITRLKAAIDEDERIAREAMDDSPWGAMNAHGFHLEDPFVGYRDDLGTVATGMRPDQAVHIVRHDPARVLRQVAAHRKILELHAPSTVKLGQLRVPYVQCEYCASLCHSRSGMGCEEPVDAAYPCDTIELLAEAYGIEP